MTGDDAEVQAAWANSFMGGLPPELLRSLAEGAPVETFPRRSIIFRGTHPESGVLLVVAGFARVFLRGSDGRQTTARYVGDSEFVGLTALLADGVRTDAQALTDVRAVRIPSHRVCATAMREPRLSWAIARFLAQHVGYSVETLGANIFLPVRARVARHLLDLARRDAEGYFVDVSQQYIADSIGSVREVVARDLKLLARHGVVERVGGALRLLDLATLHEIARDEP